MPDPQTDAQLAEDASPHSWYGPCDSLAPNGQCAECLKVAQLAEDDAAILAAAVALCWHARPVLSVGEAFYHATPQEWWERQPEMERRLHIGRARVACSAWEGFWKERGR